MRSILLLSILLAAIAIPAFAARDHNPRRGARRMLALLLLFNALYLAYLTLIHPFAFVPSW